MTIVALRTIAEALHGYVYGNEDWEDDDVYTNEQESKFEDDNNISTESNMDSWDGDGM
jgi:hypothetical protein